MRKRGQGLRRFRFPFSADVGLCMGVCRAALNVSYGDSGCRASALSCLPFRCPSAEGESRAQASQPLIADYTGAWRQWVGLTGKG